VYGNYPELSLVDHSDFGNTWQICDIDRSFVIIVVDVFAFSESNFASHKLSNRDGICTQNCLTLKT